MTVASLLCSFITGAATPWTLAAVKTCRSRSVSRTERYRIVAEAVTICGERCVLGDRKPGGSQHLSCGAALSHEAGGPCLKGTNEVLVAAYIV